MKTSLSSVILAIGFKYTFERRNPSRTLDKKEPETFISHGKSWNRVREGYAPNIPFNALVEVFVDGQGPAGTNFMCNFFWWKGPRIVAWRMNEVKGYRKRFIKKVEDQTFPPLKCGWYTPISELPDGLKVVSPERSNKLSGPFWTFTSWNLWILEPDRGKLRPLIAVDEADIRS